MKVWYRYDCACKQDPQHGDISSTAANVRIALTMLDRAWEEGHNRPGCTPAEQARKVTEKKPQAEGAR